MDQLVHHVQCDDHFLDHVRGPARVEERDRNGRRLGLDFGGEIY